MGHILAVDLVDSFYLFRYERLAEYFAFSHAFRAREFNLTEIVDSEGHRDELGPDDFVFACLATLPM